MYAYYYCMYYICTSSNIIYTRYTYYYIFILYWYIQHTGKSTVLHLLQRYYNITTGSITIDNIDIQRLDPRWLHRNVVIVPQEPVLFSGTIFSNIA